MKTQSLVFLLEAARHGKISRAAHLLGVSQPRLSQAITDIETELGQTLFERTGRGIVATPSGVRALGMARDIVADLNALESEMAKAGAEPAEHVTLGLPPSVCHVLAPPLITALREALPRATVRVLEGYSGAIQKALIDGEADIGILYSGQSHTGMPADRVLVERLVLVGAAGDPALSRPAIPLRDAYALPLALPSKRHGLRQLVDREARALGLTLNVHIEIDAMPPAKDLCRQGGFYTILPSCAVSREIAQGILAARPIVEPDLKRSLCLATTTARPLTAAARTAARLCVATARNLVQKGEWLGEL
jgi:LysR family nitrogen assimilation transcriptional regulator